jgi:hypothetical protein
LKLVPNWQRVLRHAWSIRLLILAGVLSGAEVALPLLGGVLPIPTGVFAFLSATAAGGAFVARLVAQKSVSGDHDENPE